MIDAAIIARPDDVYRTGVIQPYSIMDRTAGQQAQDTISRFIQVARPEGAHIGLDGAGFGLVTPEVIRTLGAVEDEKKKAEMHKYYWAAGGVVLGILGGVLIGKALQVAVPAVYTISGAPLGQEPAPEAAIELLKSEIKKREDEIDRVKKQSWYIAGGSAVIGVLVGVFVGIAVKGS